MEASKANIVRVASSARPTRAGIEPNVRWVSPVHCPYQDADPACVSGPAAPILLSTWRWRRRLTAVAAVMALNVDDKLISDLAGRLTDAGA